MRIARESLPISAGLLLLAAAISFLHPGLMLVPLAGLLFTLWFFRDPERRTPEDHGAMFSPADGRVIRVGAERISIFLNVFNVHVCRAPIGGEVHEVEHVAGRFLAAMKDGASEHNERTSIVLADGERRIRFTLVAGLVARRIVCKVVRGQRLKAGERVGLIQFGSRVDVALPKGALVLVRQHQRVVAGETVLARLPASGGAVDDGSALLPQSSS